MLVAVQLPDHLVVADARVEVRHVGPEGERRPPIVDGIAVPVDVAVAARARERAVSQQVVPPGEQGFRSRGGIRRGARPAGEHLGPQLPPARRIEDEPRGPGAEVPGQLGVDVAPLVVPHRCPGRSSIEDAVGEEPRQIVPVPPRATAADREPLGGEARGLPGPPARLVARQAPQPIERDGAHIDARDEVGRPARPRLVRTDS